MQKKSVGEMRVFGEWTPMLDISETKDALVVKAEIPGIDSKDISVSLEGQMLMIKGEKKHEKEEKGARSRPFTRTACSPWRCRKPRGPRAT